MSGFSGVVNFTGEPVSTRVLQAMCNAQSHLGPDGTSFWNGGTVGLTHQMMRTTWESLSEELPLHIPDSNLTITADARIDNRDDLFQKLEIPHTDRPTFTDSLLILKAYEKWADDCTDHLIGDFAFAIWDKRLKRLFCCRDHMGVRGLVYYYDGKRFVFASEAKGIFAVPEIRKELEGKRLAVIRMRGYFNVDNESSFYKNISILPAATRLAVTEKGISKRNYWMPDPTARLSLKCDDEILDAFRVLMGDAVRARLRSNSPVVVMLSGGLDSSAITSIAARQLEAKGERLASVSAVSPEHLRDTVVDERDFIDQFREWPNIDLNYVADPLSGPFDDVEELVNGYESPMVTSRHYLYTEFVSKARAMGSRVILDGVYGELGPTFHGNGYYAELLFRLRLPTLVHELTRLRKISGLSLKTDLLRVVVPDFLLRRTKMNNWQTLTPLRQDFVERELKGVLPRFDSASTSFRRMWPDHRKNQNQRILAVCRKPRNFSGFNRYEEAERRFPFLDKRLLEFCLAVPGNLKMRDGYKRYLIRAGLDGILPPAIQWRTDKLAFSPDYQIRYNRQRPEVVSQLDSISANDPVRDVVDVDRLRTLAAKDMAQLRAKGLDGVAAMHIVPIGIYTIAFLRQFSEFRK